MTARIRRPAAATRPVPRLTVVVPLRRGRCRWCGCTYYDPCPEGCGWADPTETLCTACARLDGLVRSPAGRRALAALVQEAGDAP
jgi:hypothetical protein